MGRVSWRRYLAMNSHRDVNPTENFREKLTHFDYHQGFHDIFGEFPKIFNPSKQFGRNNGDIVSRLMLVSIRFWSQLLGLSQTGAILTGMDVQRYSESTQLAAVETLKLVISMGISDPKGPDSDINTGMVRHAGSLADVLEAWIQCSDRNHCELLEMTRSLRQMTNHSTDPSNWGELDQFIRWNHVTMDHTPPQWIIDAIQSSPPIVWGGPIRTRLLELGVPGEHSSYYDALWIQIMVMVGRQGDTQKNHNLSCLNTHFRHLNGYRDTSHDRAFDHCIEALVSMSHFKSHEAQQCLDRLLDGEVNRYRGGTFLTVSDDLPDNRLMMTVRGVARSSNPIALFRVLQSLDAPTAVLVQCIRSLAENGVIDYRYGMAFGESAAPSTAARQLTCVGERIREFRFNGIGHVFPPFDLVFSSEFDLNAIRQRWRDAPDLGFKAQISLATTDENFRLGMYLFGQDPIRYKAGVPPISYDRFRSIIERSDRLSWNHSCLENLPTDIARRIDSGETLFSGEGNQQADGTPMPHLIAPSRRTPLTQPSVDREMMARIVATRLLVSSIVTASKKGVLRDVAIQEMAQWHEQDISFELAMSAYNRVYTGQSNAQVAKKINDFLIKKCGFNIEFDGENGRFQSLPPIDVDRFCPGQALIEYLKKKIGGDGIPSVAIDGHHGVVHALEAESRAQSAPEFEPVYVTYVDRKTNLFGVLRHADGATCCASSNPKTGNDYYLEGGNKNVYDTHIPSWVMDGTTFFFQVHQDIVWSGSVCRPAGNQIGWFKGALALTGDGDLVLVSNPLYLAQKYQNPQLIDAVMTHIRQLFESLGVVHFAVAYIGHKQDNMCEVPPTYLPTPMTLKRLQVLDGPPVKSDVMLAPNEFQACVVLQYHP
ncbi:hypothetical protein EB093_06220 [bacterium]|nr:hypothetical protein [bacterium]